jgi:hypothetical protein
MTTMPNSNPTTPTKTADEIIKENGCTIIPVHIGNERLIPVAKTALHQAIADMVERIIGDDVVLNMHPGLLQANQDAQNRLRKIQRQRKKAELDKFFGVQGGSREQNL